MSGNVLWHRGSQCYKPFIVRPRGFWLGSCEGEQLRSIKSVVGTRARAEDAECWVHALSITIKRVSTFDSGGYADEGESRQEYGARDDETLTAVGKGVRYDECFVLPILKFRGWDEERQHFRTSIRCKSWHRWKRMKWGCDLDPSFLRDMRRLNKRAWRSEKSFACSD